ncbi:hypothetical protein CGLO_13996 [Colletotrichum gloeosporioides Cg-14]|uniref:Uncharacterized protein n=1 Tax=Colletotrichum gloeosporioides (strain Cg-14) TaxID=1237896 RepID=T0LEV6_COLGC|nr:hypothetical protein CGLO_13996 [Colletotrichum gloeosporioides Cg-14]
MSMRDVDKKKVYM